MFVMACLVRMPIFETFGQREQNFTSKILQMGEKEKVNPVFSNWVNLNKKFPS